jgi:hypothetical protein
MGFNPGLCREKQESNPDSPPKETTIETFDEAKFKH